jgi:hypothetical protein
MHRLKHVLLIISIFSFGVIFGIFLIQKTYAQASCGGGTCYNPSTCYGPISNCGGGWAFCEAGGTCCQLVSCGGGGGVYPYPYPAPGGGGGGYSAPYSTPYASPYAYPYPYPAPRYDITGTVWVDTNRNGARDGGEGPCYLCSLTLSGAGSAGTTSNPSGGYGFFNYLAGGYNVTLTIPPGWAATTPAVRGTTLGPDRVINFGIVRIYTIGGAVFNDINKNHLMDAGDEPYTGGISITSNGGTMFVNNGSGQYIVSNLFAGTYNIAYTSPIPAGYLLVNPRNGPPPSYNVTVGPGCNGGGAPQAVCVDGNMGGINFAISNSIPWLQSYGLDMRFDSGLTDIIPEDPVYPPYASAIDEYTGGSGGSGSSQFMGQATFTTTNNVGATVGGLTVGRAYRVVVSGTWGFTAALHYDAQWSDNGGTPNCYCRFASGPYFNGTFMRSIDYQTSHNPAHVYTFQWNANSTQLRLNIEDSNFSDNWGSMTFAVYYDPPAPPTSQSTTPGVVFTGDTSSNFGNGQASAPNWVVGGSLYREVYSQTANPSTTSYQYLTSKASHANVAVTNMTSLSGCLSLANCTLPANLPNGVYQANGNLNLNGYTFPANRDYVFLINGDLTIRGNLVVPNGSVAMFSANRDIIVNRAVGSATNSFPLPAGQVQGLFSANRNFIVDAINDCVVGADRMLNIEGAIVTNAGATGGLFDNNRDLCGDNPNVPSFTVKPRLDMLLNAPTFIMKQKTIFREDAP